MMRMLLLAAGLAVLPLKADAQRWTSTFFGCDPGRSCHRIIFDMEPDPDGLDWIVGTASWQSWFFDPGVALRFVPYPQAWGGWDLWNLYVQFVWYDAFTTPYYATGRNDRVEKVSAVVSYGPLGLPHGLAPFLYEDDVAVVWLDHVGTTHVTPEPASSVLLLTGLGWLATAARRRKTGERATPTS